VLDFFELDTGPLATSVAPRHKANTSLLFGRLLLSFKEQGGVKLFCFLFPSSPKHMARQKLRRCRKNHLKKIIFSNEKNNFFKNEMRNRTVLQWEKIK